MSGTYAMRINGSKAILLPSRLVRSAEELKALSSPGAIRIFKEYSTPSCPIDIAEKLSIHEQKVYYHTKRFKKLGFLKEVKSEQRHGTVARFYQATQEAFILTLGHEQNMITMRNPMFSLFLEPFIVNGEMNSTIVVGSPDPHGPFNLRASDGCCAIDLALFLGSFLNKAEKPNYKLDVEMRNNDMKNNLILIGGPSVNMTTRKVSKFLPVSIETEGQTAIHSKITGKRYADDEDGMVVVAPNPFSSKHKIMIMAGKRFQGTRAAVITVIKGLDMLFEGRKSTDSLIYNIVKGKDSDGNGTIDSFEILE